MISTRPPRGWHFFFLILPYGASFGFVSGALPYLARQQGVDVAAIGALVAAAFVPHAWKFLWAPVVDATWTRKGWYAAAIALVASGTFASVAVPVTAASLRTLTTVVVASQIGLTLLGMACEGMIGHGVPAEHKGAASSWFQAGVFLGGSLGAAGGIELVPRVGGRLAGAILGAALAACALPLLLFDEPPVGANRVPFGAAVRALLRDLWRLVRSRSGAVALFICVSPVGSGAASNLFGAIADEWHASRDVVALTTGALSGIVSACGASAGVWLLDRVSRRSAYALAGALTAGSAVAMALAPHAPWAYVVFTLVYQAFNGLSFAAFSAFAFETVGGGAVASKYNVLASLVNASIVYATRVDSLAHGRWGGGGVLLTDAALTACGIAVLIAILAATRPRDGITGDQEIRR